MNSGMDVKQCYDSAMVLNQDVRDWREELQVTLHGFQ